MSETGHAEIHRSEFEAASPGDRAVSTWSDQATPSQGCLTLGASSHREFTMGEPIDRCSMWLDLQERCREVSGCVVLGDGDTLLWEHPSRKVSLCRPSRAPPRCGPDCRSSRTTLSRSSDPPFILSASSGVSSALRSAVVGGTHVSSGGESTRPNTAVGERLRSAYVQFVTTYNNDLVRYNVVQSIII